VRAAVALQEPARLLQHLFYFIAHKTTALTSGFMCDKNKINVLFHFIAACILYYCRRP